jgi:hypothetical protein
MTVPVGGDFEPQIIGKNERRFTGFDDKIIGAPCACIHPLLREHGPPDNPGRIRPARVDKAV